MNTGAIARALTTALAFTAMIAVAQNPALPAPPTTSIIGIKVLKRVPAPITGAATIDPPANCSCEVLHGPIYEGENAREAFFYLRVPLTSPALKGVHINLGQLDPRAIIVEKNSIPFQRTGNVITFDMPIRPTTRSLTVELQTNLAWPGVIVRIEHAFPDRAAGMYAPPAPWPAVQRQATLNLEFALREAIRTLGLDRLVATRKLGIIHLMGFDTNDPVGHEDYPPHVHIILRWPHFAGSQAPHLYLTPAGLFDRASVTIDGLSYLLNATMPEGIPMPNGKPFPTVDYLGESLYSLTLNDDHTLTLATIADTCTLTPQPGPNPGYASGVIVRCTGAQPRLVSATDNVDKGELSVTLDGKPSELYHYDPDTGTLKDATPSLPKLDPQ